MPLYCFTCPNCGWTGDRFCAMAERDSQVCAIVQLSNLRNIEFAIGRDGSGGLGGQADRKVCGTKLVREEIPASVTMDPKGSFQFGMDFGRGVIKGHAGKEARRKGPRYVKP